MDAPMLASVGVNAGKIESTPESLGLLKRAGGKQADLVDFLAASE